MRYTLLTIFPALLRPWTEESLIKRAIEQGLIEIDIRNIRDYAQGRHRVVDDAPYGGGAGMVMRVDVAVRAVEAALPADEVVLLTPAGAPFTQRAAEELSQKAHLVLLAGRYEGIDARIESYVTREISVGDYVLMGGEVAALAIVEATTRLIPGVLGDPESHQADSFSNSLLDYPEYTRPAEFRGDSVPEVLTSGNHGEIARWRAEQARLRTKERRPDLLRPR